MVADEEKGLGQALLARARQEGWMIGPTPGLNALLEFPRDAVVPGDHVFKGLQGLGVLTMSAELLEGTDLRTVVGVSLGADAPAVRQLLLGARRPRSVQYLVLWAGTNGSEVLDRYPGVQVLLLEAEATAWVDRAQKAIRVHLLGPREVDVASPLALPKLKHLELRDPQGLPPPSGNFDRLRIQGSVDPARVPPWFQAKGPNLRIDCPALGSIAWERGVLLASPRWLAALGPPADVPVSTLVVLPGDAEPWAALAPWARSVEDLRLPRAALSPGWEGLLHGRLTRLSLEGCGLSDASVLDAILAVAPKLAHLDLSDNDLPDIDARGRVRLRQQRTHSGDERDLPGPDVLTVPPMEAEALALRWSTDIATELQAIAGWTPGWAAAEKKVSKALKDPLWPNVLGIAAEAFYQANELLTWRVPNRAALDLDQIISMRRLIRAWETLPANPPMLARLAAHRVHVGRLHAHWRHLDAPTGPVPAAVDVVWRDIDAARANREEPLPAELPFASLIGTRIEGQLEIGLRWAFRLVQPLLLRQPGHPATKALKKARSSAWLGDVNDWMNGSSLRIRQFDDPRAERIASALDHFAADLQANRPALQPFAVRCRRIAGHLGEAVAQELDASRSTRRVAWREVSPQVVACWVRDLLAQVGHGLPEYASQGLLAFAAARGKLPDLPLPPADADPASWALATQLVMWIDLLQSAKAGDSRTTTALLCGRDMAVWCRRERLCGTAGSRVDLTPIADRLSDLQDGTPVDVHKRIDWSAMDPVCDRWARECVQSVGVLLGTESSFVGLLDSWEAGIANRMSFRWPSMNPLLEPSPDPWVRARDQLAELSAAGHAPWAHVGFFALQVLVEGSLNGDDYTGWVGQLLHATTVLSEAAGRRGFERAVLVAELETALSV